MQLIGMLGSPSVRRVAISLQQPELTTAVTWHFVQQMLPEVVDAARHRALAALSAAAEALPAFKAAPHGAANIGA